MQSIEDIQELERANAALDKMKEKEAKTKMHTFVVSEKLTIKCKNEEKFNRYKKLLKIK